MTLNFVLEGQGPCYHSEHAYNAKCGSHCRCLQTPDVGHIGSRSHFDPRLIMLVSTLKSTPYNYQFAKFQDLGVLAQDLTWLWQYFVPRG